MIAIGVLKNMWKKTAVVAYQLASQHMLGETKQTHERSQDTWPTEYQIVQATWPPVLLRNAPCVMEVGENSLSVLRCDVNVGNMRRAKAKYVLLRIL